MIHNLDEHRPHITVYGKNTAHVIPLVVFEKVASGEMLITDVEGFVEFMPKIIEEWLIYVGQQ